MHLEMYLTKSVGLLIGGCTGYTLVTWIYILKDIIMDDKKCKTDKQKCNNSFSQDFLIFVF